MLSELNRMSAFIKIVVLFTYLSKIVIGKFIPLEYAKLSTYPVSFI